MGCDEVGDEGKLLLCDGMYGTCNAAYHTYCVGLTAIPRGHWYCPNCVQRKLDKPARALKRKRGDDSPLPVGKDGLPAVGAEGPSHSHASSGSASSAPGPASKRLQTEGL